MASETNSPVSSPSKRTFAIVYQFGKVASTSLVATLNEIENVEAFQSHFLGDLALKDSLASLLSPDTPQYFFEHQLGQFVENVRLTRRLRATERSTSDERLLVIALTREPLEWFRSSVVQDIDGHLPRFRDFLERIGVHYDDDGAAVQLALTRLMSIFSRMFDYHGGVDNLVAKLKTDANEVFTGTQIENDTQSQMFFYMMLRPFSWFPKHFEGNLSVRLADMEEHYRILNLSTENADYFVFRYEELEKSFRECLSRIGFENIPEIAQRNISSTKKFSGHAKMAFHSPSALRLQAHFYKTEYARRFWYCEST